MSNIASSNVSAFVLDVDRGTLAALHGSPFSLGSGSSPNAITTNPAGTFLFAAEFFPGKVGAYVIDGSGALSSSPNSPFSAGGYTYDVRVDPSGPWLYAANDQDGTVSGYSIDSSYGSLTALPHSPYSAENAAVSTAITPSGQFAFVVNGSGGAVSRYSVTPSRGNAGDLASLGTATSLGVTASPYQVVVDPSGRFLYTANSGTDDVSGFNGDSSEGLSGLTNSPFSTGVGSSPYSLTVDPKGRFLYVADKDDNTKMMKFTLPPTNERGSMRARFVDDGGTEYRASEWRARRAKGLRRN